MSRRQILVAFILAGFGFAAIVLAVYSSLVTADLSVALVGAVACLAMAQMTSYISRVTEKQDEHHQVRDLMAAGNGLSRDMSVMRKRVDRLEGHISAVAAGARVMEDQQVSALRDTASRMRRNNPGAPVAQRAATPGRSEPRLIAQPETHSDMLYLEPVVRLADNTTVYYRAHIEFAPGVRSAGLELFERAAPVIRRLQGRGRAVGLFCPVESAHLADDGFIDRLVQFVEANQDIAGSLVLDISQPDLARLQQDGQRGLAYLAQLGATFSLSQCRLNVPDLSALKALGFTFLDADVRLLIDAKRNAPCPAADVLAEARRLGLSLIAADVVRDSELSWIQDGIDLARGHRFAAPRPVRQDITSPTDRQAAA